MHMIRNKYFRLNHILKGNIIYIHYVHKIFKMIKSRALEHR